MAREKDYESLLANWPYEYYHTRDAAERRTLLEMSMERKLDPEADQVRMMIWERRYPKAGGKNEGGNGLLDTYLKSWMDFRFASDKMNSWFHAKGLIKEAKKNLEAMGFDMVKEYGETGAKALYDELYHMAGLYMDLCSEDRNYGCFLLGIGKMSKESLINKMAREICDVAYKVPAGLGLEAECAPLKKAATEAFYDKFPNFENCLDVLISGQ